jgi:tetratricopeptide (TPR) repeat protein
VLGTVILAGLPFFYLLTFCGEAEESEVEIAALCAALGIGLFQLFAGRESLLGDKFIFAAPLILYFIYVTRLLPSLKVFKHTLRGYTALNLGQHVEALLSFKRALALAPKDDLAANGMWELHQRVDVAKLPSDSPLLEHLDYDFCLNQAAAYLMQTPSEAERQKAVRMLDLVEQQKPALTARVDYLRAIALTHAKKFDEAAHVLSRLLDPETPYETRTRNRVLFDAWDLALRLHPELIKRLGEAELAKPGRRMQAIAAVERTLAAEPRHPVALELQAVLYAGLSEAEYVADAASGPPREFNYDYAEQLGLAFVEKNQTERGMAFLRIAGRGLPERGPAIFSKLAELAEPDAARGYREQVKRCGQQIGVKNLAADQRPLYFAAVKQLAADAEARGDFEAAIGDYRLWLESGAGELEGFRKLADLYEHNKDAMNALLMTETGLVYNSADKDLLARKDRYYYSVEIDRLKDVRDKVERFFDVDYCVNKAKQILDRDPDAESLDWALHLAQLAKVIKPNETAVRLVEARVLLRKGDRDAALQKLEDIREETKPTGSGDDAWYVATKILADLYFNDFNRPDLAVHCYQDYRNYSKSGADTLFNIAKCYEAAGDHPRAIKFYEAVTAYEQHPKYWDAKEAISRLTP